MSRKFVNRRRERRMQDASARYEKLEAIIVEINLGIEDATREFDDVVLLLDDLRTNFTLEDVADFQEDFEEIKEELAIVSEDFEHLQDVFEQISKLKEKANEDNRSHQSKLLRRIENIFEDAEDLLDEVEDLRDDIFELHDEIAGEEKASEKIEFKSIEDVSGMINQAFERIKDAFNSDTFMFGKGSKSSKLVSILPFLEKEELKEVVEMILNDDEAVKDLPLATVFPFLEPEDIDKIFVHNMKRLSSKDLASIIPFVSQEALSKLVDEYIAGNIEQVNIDVLYPFLNQSDIKKIFFHELRKKKE